MSRLVYLPASPALAARLRAGEAAGPWAGHTASPGLRADLAGWGTEPDDDELQYAALNAAAIAQLVDPRATDPRLVLAAEVADADLVDLDRAEPGAVTIGDLAWQQVTALFADAPEATAAVATARRAVRDTSVAAALAAPEVVELLEQHDLLWYAPEELDGL